MRQFYGPQYATPRHSGGVVPRALAVQLARERDVMAQQLQRASAQISRLEEQVRVWNDRLPAPAEVLMSSAEFDEARQMWAEELQRVVAQRDDLQEQLDILLDEREEMSDVQVSIDETHAQVEEAHQRELSKWMRIAQTWEEDYARLQGRQSKSLEEARQESRRQVLTSFFDLRDSLSMALAYMDDEEDNPWRQGIDQVLNRFDDIIQREGLSVIGRKGDRFDPTVHEAIAAIPGGHSNHIAHVERQGYAFADGVLARAAKVVVYA